MLILKKIQAEDISPGRSSIQIGGGDGGMRVFLGLERRMYLKLTQQRGKLLIPGVKINFSRSLELAVPDCQ